MVVQHNMQAINSNRQLNVVTGQQAKSTEKLSSGFKINRAADDAAGLSISEKMRRQIRGLDRASTNASDGISAVQTAEGALNEVHDMLQRMNELANQASNGTNSQTDREAIQSEIDALNTEIDRVSETTKFNETYLLGGGDSTKKIYMKAHDAGLKGNLVDNEDGTATFNAELKAGDTVKIGTKSYTLKEDDGKVATNIKDIAKGVNDLRTGDKAIRLSGNAKAAYQVADNLSSISLGQTGNADLQFSGAGTINTDGTSIEAQSSAYINELGNRVRIDYTDKDGKAQSFEMEFNYEDMVNKTGDKIWQKVTGYNSKTGESNLSGTALYKADESVIDNELKDVLRTATKITATQAGTGETITFGNQETIAESLEEDSQVGDKIYLTKTPGDGLAGDNTLTKVYEKVNAAKPSDPFKPDEVGLDEYKSVKETDEVNVDDNGAITIHDAKKLMAQEMTTANSISVDDVKDVATASRKNGSDIANELSFSQNDRVTIKKSDQGGEDKEIVYRMKGNLDHNTVGVTSNSAFDNIINAYNKNDDINNTLNANSRITIRNAAGEVTELKYDDTTNATNTKWKRVDDDTTLTASDVKELLKDAVAIDFDSDSSKAEVTYTEKKRAAQSGVTLDQHNIVRWRTEEGMRQDIAELNAGDKVKVANYGKTDADLSTVGGVNWDETNEVDPANVLYDTGDIEVKNDSGSSANFDMKIGSAEVKTALDFNLHVGADADLTNKIGVGIEEISSKYLGTHGLDVVGKDKDGNNIDDGGKAATYAIDAIEDAIAKVNEQRSSLGSVQNRLEHTIKNLDNVVENTTAAESRIRDTDIADEMVNYSKNNILAQAGQSMLAQANQSTQGALSLLG